MFGYLFGLEYEVFVLVDDDRTCRKAISTIIKNRNNHRIKENLKTNFKIDNNEGDCLLERLFSENDKEKYKHKLLNHDYYRIFKDNSDNVISYCVALKQVIELLIIIKLSILFL